jgi:hypothetical protein
MIPPVQQKALAVLAELCDLEADDMRLGQLCAVLGFLGEDETGRTLWDIEDDELLRVMHQHRTNLVARLADWQQEIKQPGGAGLPNADSVAIGTTPPADVGH